MTYYLDFFVAGTLIVVLTIFFLFGSYFLGKVLWEWAVDLQHLWGIRTWRRRVEMLFMAWLFFCACWMLLAVYR